MTVVQAIAMEDQIFQLITLAFIAVGVGLEFYQWLKEPRENYWTYSHALWMLHASFFYVFVTLDRYTTLELKPLFGSYTLWSSILRMQIVVTFVILEWFRIRQSNLRKMKRLLLAKIIQEKEDQIQRLIAENLVLRSEKRGP